MLRETWMQCPFMFTTFCAACACGEALPCAIAAPIKAEDEKEAVQPMCSDCIEPKCPCWSLYNPPLTRVVRFLAWYIFKLNLERKIDDETAFALGKSIGWLSMVEDGPKVLTDEEVIIYARRLPDVFSAGLSHSNPNFFDEGGSFLGSARSNRTARE